MLEGLKNAMRVAALASDDVVVAGFLLETLEESEGQVLTKLGETCWSNLLSVEPVTRKDKIRAVLSRRYGDIEQGCNDAF